MNKKSKTRLTKFQWKVLSVTATIPLGETRSYQWVAREIGSPKAVRAVGQALRRNPYPVIIPCHRVIHANGALGGYAGRFGKRKAQLLNKEREIAAEMKPSKLPASRRGVSRKGFIPEAVIPASRGGVSAEAMTKSVESARGAR